VNIPIASAPEGPDTSSTMSTSNGHPARLSIWEDCPRCGRTARLEREFRFPGEEVGASVEKVALRCERCGQPAYLYMQRIVAIIH
jgi:ribosomal protein L37E